MINFLNYIYEVIDMAKKASKTTTVTPAKATPILTGYELMEYGEEDWYDERNYPVGTPVDDVDEEYEEAEFCKDLVDACIEIENKPAGAYINHAAYLLDSYVDSHCLLEIFDWEETRQGYDHWEKIYHELVENGYQHPPEAEFKLYDLMVKKGKVVIKKGSKK